MGQKVESVPANTVPDALTTQLAEQSWSSYKKKKDSVWAGDTAFAASKNADLLGNILEVLHYKLR